MNPVLGQKVLKGVGLKDSRIRGEVEVMIRLGQEILLTNPEGKEKVNVAGERSVTMVLNVRSNTVVRRRINSRRR